MAMRPLMATTPIMILDDLLRAPGINASLAGLEPYDDLYHIRPSRKRMQGETGVYTSKQNP
jgi:hypothetical protein